MRYRVSAVVAALMLAAAATTASAQRGRGAGPAPPQSGQAGAPVDLTGYWVAIVDEDWRWRMVTPPKGDYASVANLMTPEARKIADSWDTSKDGSCLAYGAAALMRMPLRLHITWETDNVLKIDTDQGQQTRRLLFDKSTAPPAAPSLQGFSIAEWERPGRGGGGPAGAAGPPAAGRAGGQTPNRGGSLKVVTTRLTSAWLRRNGVPYSESTTVTEFYDRFPGPANDNWLVVTTVVADPKYLTQEFVTSSHFRMEPDGKKWDPAPCKP